MEERNPGGRADRLPNEVVETYRRPRPDRVPGERVFTYRHPRPAAPAEPERDRAPARPRRRRGLWIFLACLAVVVVLAGISALLNGGPAVFSDDPF